MISLFGVGWGSITLISMLNTSVSVCLIVYKKSLISTIPIPTHPWCIKKLDFMHLHFNEFSEIHNLVLCCLSKGDNSQFC